VLLIALSLPAWAAPLATAEVSVDAGGDVLVADGVVEAVRQSEIAAQVPGRITALLVKAGDRVKAGQVLVRIDERIADQQAQAGRSQVAALAAQLDAAGKEYQRKRQLFEQGFLSKAALERAESDFKTAQAQTKAQMSQVESSVVQTGLHALLAPYAGIVAKVHVELGDMASPGKPLITFYDPAALRVVVNVPQTRVGALRSDAAVIEIPAAPPALAAIKASAMTVLPTADPVSQMVQVRFDLPVSLSARSSQAPGRPKIGLAPLGGDSGQGAEPGAQLVPGMFARARLTIAQQGQSRRMSIPSRALFRRSEVTAVYVLDARGHPQLRLVRSGRTAAECTEILAGLEPGEKVVLDPLAAIPR
jgi:RND family efflux transporter MFP subunit